MALNYSDKLRSVIMGAAQNAVQKLTPTATELMFMLCVKYQHKVALARKALVYFNNSAEERRLVARLKLCRFVIDKFYAGCVSEDSLNRVGAAINEAQGDLTEEKVARVERIMLIICKAELVTSEDILNRLEIDMNARITARAKSVNNYHELTTALEHSEYNSWSMRTKVQRDITKAAIGVTPAKFKRDKNLSNKVSARSYMGSTQLEASAYLLSASANIISQGVDKEEFKQRLHSVCSFIYKSQAEAVQDHGDHGLHALEASDGCVKHKREELQRERMANMERIREMNERLAAPVQEEEEDDDDSDTESEESEDESVDEKSEDEKEAEEESPVRLIIVRNELYQSLVAALNELPEGEWMESDDVEELGVEINQDAASEMYNAAQPCREDCQGLLIKKYNRVSYSFKYVQ